MTAPVVTPGVPSGATPVVTPIVPSGAAPATRQVIPAQPALPPNASTPYPSASGVPNTYTTPQNNVAPFNRSSSTQAKAPEPTQSTIRVPTPSNEKESTTAMRDVSVPAEDNRPGTLPIGGGRLRQLLAERKPLLGDRKPLLAGRTAVPVEQTSLSGDPTPLANRERVVRVLPPRPRQEEVSRPISTASASEPRPPQTAPGGIDIMDLPPVVKSDSTSASGPSAREPAESTESPSAAALRNNYARGDNYETLRGRLEFSQVDRRWKLRYVPIDGQTDQYGGSVILSDPNVLRGCERGDFVEVRGKLGETNPKKEGFAPVYQVAELKKL
jgi:hypothetical protein